MTSVSVTEKVFDHLVDGVCAVGITYTATAGGADPVVVGGLTTIALGKRYFAKRQTE